MGYKPLIFYSKWKLYDYLFTITDHKKPFYEYGVSFGYSFEYLLNNYIYGYGFDTFYGLPEKWYHEEIGTYTTNGVIPELENCEFIKGNFTDTLPIFFKTNRETASLINCDADLYSSTFTALNYSKDIIDEKTVIVFDQLITNDSWEKDEYKALLDFCTENNYTYTVIAVSFFSKQVAVKIFKN